MMRDQNITIIVLQADISNRLDIFISEKRGITRSQVQRLIKSRHVHVNNIVESHGYKVKINDVITIYSPDEEIEGIIPEPIPVEILHRDEYLVVVNKAAGVVVYPAVGHRNKTLLNALLYHCRKLAIAGGPLRPGVVHRLDKDTSGVMVVALDDNAYYGLAKQFENRRVNRKYIALIYGDIKGDYGKITMQVGRSVSDRKKMSTKTRHGKEAVTTWNVIKRFGVAALIGARLETGRTHQIRVHFSAIGHPLLGDKTYGKKRVIETDGIKIAFPRQMLHAETLGFKHPVTGEYLEFSANIPEDIKECISKLPEV